MNNDKRTTLKLIIYISLVIWFCSCSPKSFTGPLTDVFGREVKCKGRKFLILKSAPMPSKGDKVTFKPVKNKKDKRINCKLIK